MARRQRGSRSALRGSRRAKSQRAAPNRCGPKMRFHRRYSLLQCWVQNPQSRELMNPDALCIARFEPAFAGASGVTVLDLTFARDERVAVIRTSRFRRKCCWTEKSRLIWPEACRHLPIEMLGQMEERLVPWLTSLVLARQANAEVVRRFSGCISNEEWESARSAAFLGASRYMNATLAMAPYVYLLVLQQGV